MTNSQDHASTAFMFETDEGTSRVCALEIYAERINDRPGVHGEEWFAIEDDIDFEVGDQSRAGIRIRLVQMRADGFLETLAETAAFDRSALVAFANRRQATAEEQQAIAPLTPVDVGIEENLDGSKPRHFERLKRLVDDARRQLAVAEEEAKRWGVAQELGF